MKKIISILIMFCLICLFSIPAIAEDKCETIGLLAEAVMKGRQVGVPASKVFEIFNQNEMVKIMIIEAYGEPKYSTERFVQVSISEFKNKWYLECLKIQK